MNNNIFLPRDAAPNDSGVRYSDIFFEVSESKANVIIQ